MNLHGIAAGAIGAVNPFVPAMYYASTGSTTNPDGSRDPGYAAPQPIPGGVQKQELSYKDLQHVDGLNLQGILCSVYLSGQAFGVTRGSKGGDKFVIAGQTWLVVAVPEQWPDWCKVILNLQVNP